MHNFIEIYIFVVFLYLVVYFPEKHMEKLQWQHNCVCSSGMRIQLCSANAFWAFIPLVYISFN
jgi:hypothetical protein